MKKGLSILLVLCSLMCILLTGCGSSETLYINDYLIVKTKGIDGYGEIEEYTLDYKAIAKKYASRGEDCFVLGNTENDKIMADEEIIAPQSNNEDAANQKIQLLSTKTAKKPEMSTAPKTELPSKEEYVTEVPNEEPNFKQEDESVSTSNNQTGFVLEDGEFSTRRYIYNDASNLEEASEMMFEDYLPRLIFQSDDKNNTLSNGDEINFSWDVDQEDIDTLQKIFKIEIKFDEVSYKVKGLTELLKVDPFENVEILFKGKNGAGSISDTAYAYISWDNGSMLRTIKAIIPKNNGSLSNGDKIHVEFTDFDPTELAKLHGICFSRTEADIELRGLNAYGQVGAKGGKKVTINLNDYLSLSSLDGIETVAIPQAQIDYKRMIIENLESLSENVAEDDLLGYESSKIAALEIMQSESPYKLTSSSHKLYPVGSNYYDIFDEQGIKNGDVIKLSWQIDKEKLAKLQKVMNVEFKCEDWSITVEGLQEIREFDPFADYEIFYDGSNGSAYASGYIKFYPYVNNPDDEMTLDFDVITDKNGSLSNGDKIILSMKSFAEPGNFMDNWGLAPTRTEIEITVSGLE